MEKGHHWREGANCSLSHKEKQLEHVWPEASQKGLLRGHGWGEETPFFPLQL